ncbi:MAG: hypothetical protein DRP81_09280 [Candidatus Omnitrophota bacterium]|nr:MAG: hypothetical protein DRP81_09280 [Candidatus Omnitrophota bacterium]
MKDKYDVVIIGAGIGGLVCGCYLAKAGLKVLIVEKNDKPGGYCSSFERDGYRFDVGVIGLENCSRNNILGRIMEDLHLDINLNRINPSEVLVLPHYEIPIWNNLRKTIKEFKKAFPLDSKQIENFFIFLKKTSYQSLYAKFKTYTLQNLLNSYFRNEKLKAVFKLISALLGQFSPIVSALPSLIMYKGFFFDGGYYPQGGMQSFIESLLRCFIQHRGKILLSSKVKKILIENNTVKGIILDTKEIINSKLVISACDVRQLYFKLMDKRYLPKGVIYKIYKLFPSLAPFMVFLKLKKRLKLKYNAKYWYTTSYSIDKILEKLYKCEYAVSKDLISISIPSLYDNTLNMVNGESICILTLAQYMNKSYWDKNKEKIAKEIIKKCKKIIDNLTNKIIDMEVATPFTYYKFTLNYRGAAYGWVYTPNHVINSIFLTQRTPVKNLFLIGQWSFQGFGASRVALSAYSVANMVINSFGNFRKEK